MAVDMLAFLAMFGSRVSIRPEKTVEIRQMIDGLDDAVDTTSCIRTLLNHYPDEDLLEFCFQRLFEVRHGGSGPRHQAWLRELIVLADCLRRNRLIDWEKVLFEKCGRYYPNLVTCIWPKGFSEVA